ncbi:MAG TPA: hypothetical protein VF861_16115 [Telluria sp.]
MKSIKKRPARPVSKEKAIPVAENSQSTKAPGARQPGSANVQSANIESAGAILRGRESLQTGSVYSEVGSERGGPGSAQAGWSSRQQAERMQARAEESRQGQPQQSGYGGMQQDQHAGSKESPTGKPGAATPKGGSGSKQ